MEEVAELEPLAAAATARHVEARSVLVDRRAHRLDLRERHLRGLAASLSTVLVAGEDQLDRYFLAHPVEVFTRSPEPAVVNLSNPFVLDPHLACAAYETRLKLGLATTAMSATAFKNIWPILVAPEVRDWTIQRIGGGTLQHLDIAVNAPLHTLARG